VSQPTRPYQPELLKALTDPTEAIEYLNAALEERSEEIFMLALQNVAEAQGAGHLISER
jgi:DNA-binding phage protein